MIQSYRHIEKQKRMTLESIFPKNIFPCRIRKRLAFFEDTFFCVVEVYSKKPLSKGLSRPYGEHMTIESADGSLHAEIIKVFDGNDVLYLWSAGEEGSALVAISEEEASTMLSAFVIAFQEKYEVDLEHEDFEAIFDRKINDGHWQEF